jgi:hypothetical protein
MDLFICKLKWISSFPSDHIDGCATHDKTHRSPRGTTSIARPFGNPRTTNRGTLISPSGRALGQLTQPKPTYTNPTKPNPIQPNLPQTKNPNYTESNLT